MWARKQNYKETAVSARRLRQYFPLTDKQFSQSFEVFLYLPGVFQISYVFMPIISLKTPLTMICGTLRFRGTSFRNTDLEYH